jgi:chromosome segregation ATPase
MNQEIVSFAGMQADHRQWDSAHSTWRADVERWQREHQSALSELAELQEMIREHGAALESHAQAIEGHQQALRDHGRAISEYEHQGIGERVQETMASKHQELAERHRTQRDAPERIEKHHRTVVARLARVKAALEAGM